MFLMLLTGVDVLLLLMAAVTLVGIVSVAVEFQTLTNNINK